MDVVPVVAGPELLLPRVRLLDRVGLLELDESLLPLPEPGQHVAVHVLRVRDTRGTASRIDLSVRGGVRVPPDVLEGVDEVVVGAEVTGVARERRLVVTRSRRSPPACPRPQAPGSSALPRRTQSSASEGSAAIAFSIARL